jgi:hypothetical protein
MVLADWQVTIGEPTSVCVYLAPIYWSQTGEYLMIPIEARADKLMRIRVSQCKIIVLAKHCFFVLICCFFL